MNRILIVEDDRGIAGNLLLLLKKEGLTAVAVGTREESLEQIRRESLGLVLPDLMLPDGNGYFVYTAIKREADIPVIFLMAMGDEESVVTGFGLGTDDYIAKPSRPLELVSRVKNMLRRRGRSRSVLRTGDLLVDTVKRTVTRDGQEVILSVLEYRLFLVSLNRQGEVLTRNWLLEEIWDIAGDYVNDNILAVYMKRLRDKIEEDPAHPEIIETVRGRGYKVGWEMAEWLRNPEARLQTGIHRVLLVTAVTVAVIIWDIGCALYAAVLCLAGSGISLWLTAKRYDRLLQLSWEVDQVLYGNDSTAGIPDEEGELAALVSKIYKMTIRLRDQAEELRIDKAYLQESLADMSHQVKTPLTSIHMLLRQLKEEENEQERSRISRGIGSLLARIEQLIVALLKMANLESGTAVLKREMVLAGDVIQKAAKPLAVPIEPKGQQLILKGQEGVRYTGDFLWSVEALGDILKNCMEHIPAGGAATVSTEKNPVYTQIQMEDTGKGFLKADLKHILERFYRGENACGDSVGIGSALSGMIIKERKGAMLASNREDDGARFCIRLYKGAVQGVFEYSFLPSACPGAFYTTLRGFFLSAP